MDLDTNTAGSSTRTAGSSAGPAPKLALAGRACCRLSPCTPPMKEAAFGRPHKGGRAACGRPPTFVETIMWDGEAAEIAEPYANLICACLHILPRINKPPTLGSLLIGGRGGLLIQG